MNAVHIKHDGQEQEVSPKNGKKFTLQELQGFVGGYIEPIRLKDGRIMLVNEEGRLKKLQPNRKATNIAIDSSFMYIMLDIVGDVIVLDESLMS